MPRFCRGGEGPEIKSGAVAELSHRPTAQPMSAEEEKTSDVERVEKQGSNAKRTPRRTRLNDVWLCFAKQAPATAISPHDGQVIKAFVGSESGIPVSGYSDITHYP